MRARFALLVFLLLAGWLGAQTCPAVKTPTSLSLVVERNAQTGTKEATATLVSIDAAQKSAFPLQGETVYFQECAPGNFSSSCPSYSHPCSLPPDDLWYCDSGCCGGGVAAKTDDSGKAMAELPGDDSVLVAAYFGGGSYLPSNSTANYAYPAVYGSVSLVSYWPFFVIALVVLWALLPVIRKRVKGDS